jgi:dihydroxynaphthoic acid synthetase
MAAPRAAQRLQEGEQVSYEEILYEADDGVATITINRPEVLNAFGPVTVRELIDALERAWDDTDIGVIVLTGAGDRAFCVGGDQSAGNGAGYGGTRGRERDMGLDIVTLHERIRDVPKPVIAAVNGYAIGGGQVLQLLCDLSIAAEHAQFGQVGPRVGSFDPGYGTLLLARTIGEKRAKELWFLCDRYSAAEACQMGLINKVVASDQLDAEVSAWCEKLLGRSPYALGMLKASFSAGSADAKPIGQMTMKALGLFYTTAEAHEGKQAFKEKRAPDYTPFRTEGPNPGRV